MPINRSRSTLRTLLAAALALCLTQSAVAQSKFRVLHRFGNGTDGAGVWSAPAFDSQGNLYGTTSGGGQYGYGAVFELSPTTNGPWNETVLHSFMLNDLDGFQPQGGLIVDSLGNLYGVTPNGGAYNSGTAFELMPSFGNWTLSVLYNFCSLPNCEDGGDPFYGMTMDSSGNLYGATGGGSIGPGAAFELSANSGAWTESVIYSFGGNGGNGGYGMGGGVIFDAQGNLYGATYWGGDLSCYNGQGNGTVYELVPGNGTWTEHVLHKFGCVQPDGRNAKGPLALDAAGNLYGTTAEGGLYGYGTVYEMKPIAGGKWRETILHNFANDTNGSIPEGGVAIDAKGNLYGATDYGGSSCGCGVVYRLSHDGHGGWSYSVIHAFVGTDGAGPTGTLISDSQGHLYGSTVLGGAYGGGVVYEITP